MSRAARVVLLLVLSALAGFALGAGSGLPRHDPLRALLATAPLAAAATALAERWLLPGAARRRRRGRIEALSLGLLLAGGASLAPLGLPDAAPIVAGGLVVLLAVHLAGLLPDLRRALGHTVPARAPLVFVVLPFLVYAALLPWSSARRPPDGDEPWYLLLCHSLAYDLDADLRNNYQQQDWRAFIDRPLAPQPGDPVGANGELYSRHDLLMPLVLAPVYRVAGARGVMLSLAAAAALLAGLVLQLVARYFPSYPGEALLAWCLFAFAPPMLFYSHQVWVEVPAALLVAAALRQILDLARPRPQPLRSWLWLLLWVVLLPLLKLRFALLAASLLLVAAARATGAGAPYRRLVLGLTSGLAAVGLITLLLNLRLYGNALKIHSWRELELYRYPLDALATHLAGPLFDSAFGLLGCAPLWLLVLPAAGLWLRGRHGTRPLLRDLLLLAAPYLLVASARNEWYGGWSPPFRYALVFLPLLAVGLVPLLRRRRSFGARCTGSALLLLTLAATLIFVVTPGFTYNLADGSNHLIDRLEARSGVELRRFAPSYVRPRAASWWWPPILCAGLVFAWRERPGTRPGTAGRRRAAEVLGVAGALLVLPGALVFAHALPSRQIELESPAVVKSGGQREPEQWVFDRLRYAESWVLSEGSRARVRLVPGGRSLTLRLRARTIRNHDAPLRLAIGVEDDTTQPAMIAPATVSLATVDLDPPEAWRMIEVGPLAWPAGARVLWLALPATPGLPQSGVAIDRIDLEWRDRAPDALDMARPR